MSTSELVIPLSDVIRKDIPSWTVDTIVGDDATKSRLLGLLGGDQCPELLLTASHGMGFPNGDLRQLENQGAILCQDWPGPVNWRKAVPPDFYLAAGDIADDVRLQGLISIHFACYGLGTPQFDEFVRRISRTPDGQLLLMALSLVCRNGCSAIQRAVHWRWSVMWNGHGAIRSPGPEPAGRSQCLKA